jgi:hypothetical protein
MVHALLLGNHPTANTNKLATEMPPEPTKNDARTPAMKTQYLAFQKSLLLS